MRLSGSTIALLAYTTTSATASAAAPDSWSGKLDFEVFVGASACGFENATYSGYASAVKAIGDGDICETDHFDTGEGLTTFYSKWVTKCGTLGALPSAIYQYQYVCTDANCSDCKDDPTEASQIPWSYFDPEPNRCMTFMEFNASSTDPAKEFESAYSNINTTSASFTGSDEDFNGYWGVFVANSCMGPEPTPSSAHVVASGIEVAVFAGVVSASLFMFFA